MQARKEDLAFEPARGRRLLQPPAPPSAASGAGLQRPADPGWSRGQIRRDQGMPAGTYLLFPPVPKGSRVVRACGLLLPRTLRRGNPTPSRGLGSTKEPHAKSWNEGGFGDGAARPPAEHPALASFPPEGTEMEIFLFTPLQQQRWWWFDSLIAIFSPVTCLERPAGRCPGCAAHLSSARHEGGRCPVSHSFHSSPAPTAAGPTLRHAAPTQTPAPTGRTSAPRRGLRSPEGFLLHL